MRLTPDEQEEAEDIRNRLSYVDHPAEDHLKYIDEEGDHDDLTALRTAWDSVDEVHRELGSILDDLTDLIYVIEKRAKKEAAK